MINPGKCDTHYQSHCWYHRNMGATVQTNSVATRTKSNIVAYVDRLWLQGQRNAGTGKGGRHMPESGRSMRKPPLPTCFWATAGSSSASACKPPYWVQCDCTAVYDVQAVMQGMAGCNVLGNHADIHTKTSALWLRGSHVHVMSCHIHAHFARHAVK